MKKKLEDNTLQLDLFAKHIGPALPAKPKARVSRKPKRTAELFAFPTARRVDLVSFYASIMAETPEAERPDRWQKYADAFMRDWQRLGLSRAAALADAKALTDAVYRLTAYYEADGGWRSGQPHRRA